MAGTFNSSVREVFSEVGRQVSDAEPKMLLNVIGYFMERLTDWYSGEDSLNDRLRESYWLHIADSAFSAYANMTHTDIDSVKRSLINLMILKQHDYGPKNILTFGEKGVIVRIYDKYARLCNLLKDGKEPKFESIADTWKDMCNYAVIAVMLIRNEFDKTFDIVDVNRILKMQDVQPQRL